MAINALVGGLRRIRELTIGSGNTQSDAFDSNKYGIPVAFLVPSAFTGASITVEVTNDDPGGSPTWHEVDSLSYTVATGAEFVIDPADVRGFRYMRLVSASSEGSDRTLPVTGWKGAF